MTNYITDFLKNNNHIGAENGIKAADILSSLGRDISEDSKRRLKKEIQHFRREWCANDSISTYILSDTENGYYLPNTDDEVIRFFATQNSRAIQSFTTVKMLRRYLKDRGYLRKKDCQNERQHNKN